MANTTFSGPVRSENSFKNVIKSATTGDLTSEMTLSVYTATVTVANGATTERISYRHSIKLYSYGCYGRRHRRGV